MSLPKHTYTSPHAHPLILTGRAPLELYANLLVTLRAARESMRREVPLNNMLIPTRVPITQGGLNGQVLQIITARIRVMIPSKTSHPDPGSGRSVNPITNSRIVSRNR